MKKNVLITGITGQDGAFLTSQLLAENKYKIIGTSREKDTSKFFQKLEHLNVDSSTLLDLQIIESNFLDYESINSLIKNSNVEFIYNLIGPGSVNESVKNPFESSKSIILAFNNLAKSLVDNRIFPKFFQTSSSEMFAQNNSEKLNELSPLSPKSPYGSSKLYIHNLITFLRNKYDWDITSGILFNHESEFRPNEYLLMKIINKAIEINENKNENLELGSFDLTRDWGFAGDHTKAMKLILENNPGEDYVIGTGRGTSIKQLTNLAFSYFDLDYTEFVSVDKKLLRSNEPTKIISDPSKIKKDIGWEPSISIEELVIRCIEFRISHS